MSSLEQRLAEGNRAKQILEDDVYTGAFDAIKAKVIDEWTNSPARDAEGRERLWTYLQMLNKLQATMQTTMETGQLASLELQHRQTAADRIKSAWIGLRSA